MMNFQYYSPTRLVVGAKQIDTVETIAQGYGKRCFVVSNETSKNLGFVDRIFDSLSAQHIELVEYIKSTGEPDVEMADAATQAASDANCDFVVSVGGGSAIDLGKAVAGLVTNGGSIADYLEGVGSGRKVTEPALLQIAIPTTAGTGAEVTRNAVISSKEGRFKKSFRSPTLYPAVAILDAELSLSLPPEQTAYSGMDAITQLIESYLTHKATPMTDALALFGMELVFRSIRDVVHEGSDVKAREDMLLASTLSGICLANAGLGMAHGFASGLGALYEIPHGKACAILLPHMMQFNATKSISKLARIGYIMHGKAGSEESLAGSAIQYIKELNAEFGIPPDLKSLEIPEFEHDLLVKMSMGNSMSGNPIEIRPDTAKSILKQIA